MADLTEKCRLCLNVAHDTVNLFRESKGVVYSDIILNFLEIEVCSQFNKYTLVINNLALPPGTGYPELAIECLS